MNHSCSNLSTLWSHNIVANSPCFPFKTCVYLSLEANAKGPKESFHFEYVLPLALTSDLDELEKLELLKYLPCHTISSN